MGRIIDIEYDGLDDIQRWASEWPEGFDVFQWEEQESHRKGLLVEQYGMEVNEYEQLVWSGGELDPVYPRLMALMDSGLVPELEDAVRINTREVPAPRPGEMYRTKDGVKSFGEVTLSERLASLGCEHCRSDGFMGGWYYEVEDDDGTVSKCRGCWRGLLGDADDGTEPALADDFGVITKWNEQGRPANWKDCSEFDWD